MKRFLLHIGLFLFPVLCVAVYYAVFYCVGVYAGEFADFDRMMRIQREDDRVLIGMGYNEKTAYYKLQNADAYRADVLALGTSRAMQITERCFSSSFYNCGGAVNGNYGEYLEFLKTLSYTPKCVVLDLDIWVFNKTWASNHADNNLFMRVTQTNNNIFALTGRIGKSYLQQNWTFRDLQNYPVHFGFNGKINANGYRRDGSYCYGSIYRANNPPDFSDVFGRIERGDSRFEYGDELDNETLIQLEALLSWCREHEIHVAAYLAPLPHAVCEKMQESGQYDYVAQITPTCKKLFSAYGFSYGDYLDAASWGISDEQFVDGLHAGEVAHAQMLIDMASQDPVLASYMDIDMLELQLETAYSGLIFEAPAE